MKVGLCLGAGGVLGGAWLTGGLDALARETGWDPTTADVIAGTSAGSVVGGFVASGLPPWYMVAHSRGEAFPGLHGPDGRPAETADRSGGASFKLHRGVPWIGPGSIELGVRTLTQPLRHTPLQMAVGWLPRGFIATDSIKEIVRRVVQEGWTSHAAFWAFACDYRTGRRVAFGRDDAPPADMADAVAASCAIPGFYRPVEIGGRLYVDGGIRSAANLDTLVGRGLDVVICLNPTSSRVVHGSPIGRLMRAEAGRRVGREVRRLRADGTEVILIQPTKRDLEVMGENLMTNRRRNDVIATAQETVAEQISDAWVRSVLKDLPPGKPHKVVRPDGPPSAWQALLDEELAA